MSERTASEAVERSCRWYERLLKLYPKAHRKEYGNAMLQLFRDQCRDAWAASRTRGLISFWLHVLPDLLKTSILEHLSNLNRRNSMLKLFRPQFTPLPVFIKVFTAVFLLAFLTSVVITFLIPESFRSTAQIVFGPVQPKPLDPYVHQNEFEIIQSHAVRKVVKALDLCDVWGEKYNRGVPLTSDRAETILKQNLEIQTYQTVRNTKIIQISAFSDDPREAAKLANEVAEAYQFYRVEDSRANNGAFRIKRRVSIIQPAVAEMHAVLPNKPLIITLGVTAGIMFGLIAGGVAAGFVKRPKGNTNPAGATRETPSNSQGGLLKKRVTNLAVWVLGSLWVSLAVPFTALILLQAYVSLSEMSNSGRPPNAVFREAVALVFLGFTSALMSLAGISLLRGKLWAKIYVGIAALAVSHLLSSSNPLYFPLLPGPFRWGIIAFGGLTVCTLLLSPWRGSGKMNDAMV